MLYLKNNKFKNNIFSLFFLAILLVLFFAVINFSYAYDMGDDESLTDGINNALNNTDTGVLDLKERKTYEAENIQIGSNKNVTIRGSGNGSVIDGLDVNRLFYLNNGSSLYLYNIVLTGGKLTNDNGNFIYNNGGYLYLENCTLSNGVGPYSTSLQGGIYATNESRTIIESCIFENLDGYMGVAIANYGILSINNSVFKNNKVRYGLIRNSGQMNLTNSEFINTDGNTYSGGYGSDVWLRENSNSYLTNITFLNSKPNHGVVNCYTDFVGRLIIDNCSFIGSSSWGKSTGVHIQGGNVSINNTLFDSNFENGATSGGAISVEKSPIMVSVNNCNFTNNTSKDGSGIYSWTDNQCIIFINNCIFNGNIVNSASYGGGALSMGGKSKYYITNSTFKNNRGIYGGAIYVAQKDIIAILINCNIINNSATQQGSAIYQRDGNLTVLYSIFMNNTNNETTKSIYKYYSSNSYMNLDYNYWGSNGLSIDDIDGMMMGREDHILVNYYISNIKLELLSNDGLYVDDVLRLKYNFSISDENGTVDIDNVGSLNDFIANIKVGNQNIGINNLTGEIGVPISEINNIYSLLFGGYEVDNVEYTALAKTGNIILDNISGIIGDNVTINATLKDHNGNPLINKKIDFYLNGVLIGSSYTNSTGIASINYLLTELGILNLTVKYEGDDYITSERLINLTVSEIPDTEPPIVSVNKLNGTYFNNVQIVFNINEDGDIYYTLDGSNPTNMSRKYMGPIILNSSATIKYIAYDLAGNPSQIYTNKYTLLNNTILTKPSVKAGTYKSDIKVSIPSISGTTIYYKLGNSPYKKYISPVTIKSSSTLSYYYQDANGVKSKVSSVKYTIDKTAPKVLDKNNKYYKKVKAKKQILKVRFSENIKITSKNLKKILVKNSKGKKISVKFAVKNNYLYVKVPKIAKKTKYFIKIPKSIVQDNIGNMLKFSTVLRFVSV